jgi:hypothetical protein
MGDGYGPIVVRKHPVRCSLGEGGSTLNPDSLSDSAAREFLAAKKITVPGKMASAFLAAFQLFLGEFDFFVVPFDKVFDAIEEGRLTATTTCCAEACLRLVGEKLHRRDKAGRVLRAASASACTSKARARDSFAHKARTNSNRLGRLADEPS